MSALLTAEQAAERLAVPVSWIYKAVAAKRIPFVKIGRYVRIEAVALERWIEDQRS